MLSISKFGYVSVVAYQKEDAEYSISQLKELFIKSIHIDSDYQYVFLSKNYISFWQMILSIAIGGVVYYLIMLICKYKK